jgi:hypothetical protein
MLKLCRELNFPPEPVCADTGGNIFRQNLYDDLPVEIFLGGEKYAAHSSTTKLALYDVGSGDF